MITNTPQDNTVIEVEARKSFSFGIFVQDKKGGPLDLADAESTFTMGKIDAFGVPTVLISRAGIIAAPALGYMQFQVQADELEVKPGVYMFTVTLLVQGYSAVLLKGDFKVKQNMEFDSVNHDYGGANPAQNLFVKLRDDSTVHVTLSTLLPPSLTIPTDASDAAVAGYFMNPASATRLVTGGLYAPKAETAAGLANLQAQILDNDDDIAVLDDRQQR